MIAIVKSLHGWRLNALSGILFFKLLRQWHGRRRVFGVRVLMPSRAFCFLNASTRNEVIWKRNYVLMPSRAFCFLNKIMNKKFQPTEKQLSLNALSGILFFWGSVWHRPLQYFYDHGTSKTPSPTIALSGILFFKPVWDNATIYLSQGLNALSGILFFKLNYTEINDGKYYPSVLMPSRAFCFLNLTYCKRIIKRKTKVVLMPSCHWPD